LLAANGKEFELQLLLNQNEALTYGSHLAEVVARGEESSTRAEFLRKLSGDLGKQRQRVVAMLLEGYTWKVRNSFRANITASPPGGASSWLLPKGLRASLRRAIFGHVHSRSFNNRFPAGPGVGCLCGGRSEAQSSHHGRGAGGIET